MSKTNAFETSQLTAEFNPGSGNYDVGLFTADPGEAGSTANEATYTSYARQSVIRSAAGWTVSGNSVTNAAEILFPEATGGSETLTHFAIFDGATMVRFGALTSSLAVSTGIQPRFAIGALTVTED